MDHYLDLKLLPDPEFPATLLMSALLAKLHRASHDLRRTDVGISFPDTAQNPRHLGACLRVHGVETALHELQALNWLNGVRDHVETGTLQPVPAQVKYRNVCRVQVDSNPERLRRRLMKRHDLSEEEARQRIPEGTGKRCTLPFASLRSATTGQAFRLFIRHGALLDAPHKGSFSSYGLSSTATIPWF